MQKIVELKVKDFLVTGRRPVSFGKRVTHHRLQYRVAYALLRVNVSKLARLETCNIALKLVGLKKYKGTLKLVGLKNLALMHINKIFLR